MIDTVRNPAGATATPHFVFVIGNEFPLYTLVLLMEPLRITNQNAGQTLFTWQVVAENDGECRAGNGSWWPVDCRIDKVDHADVMIVLGGNLPFRQVTRKLVAQLHRFARRGAIIGSTNTGTIVLAAAGLLESRQATIHWESIPAFVERFPDITIVECLYVRDRDRITCSGGIAALDMMLDLIGEFKGRPMANEVANALIHIKRASQDRQRPAEASLELEHTLAADMVRLMESNIEHPLDSGELAHHLNCSRRTMERASRLVLQDSPMRVYLKIRLQVARNLLFYDQTPIGEIALICGFSTTSEFSRTFKACYSKTPREFREEFRRRQGTRIRPELSRLQTITSDRPATREGRQNKVG
jgi:transcriptional regulator GlxA family with amidase domain